MTAATRPDYSRFLHDRQHSRNVYGFTPKTLPGFLFDFQRDLVTWAVERGRAAIFADCGMGKTPMQLVWAQNIVEHTNRRVLILCPLAVAHQTVEEAAKFGIPVTRSHHGELAEGIVVTNYDRLHHFNPDDFAGVVILRKTAEYPAGVQDGTLIYSGRGTSVTDYGLLNGAQYYYTAFAFDSAGNYSAGERTSAVPIAAPDSTPPANISDFMAIPGFGQI